MRACAAPTGGAKFRQGNPRFSAGFARCPAATRGISEISGAEEISKHSRGELATCVVEERAMRSSKTVQASIVLASSGVCSES